MLKLVKAPHGFLTYCDLFRWHFATLTNPALPLPDTAQVTMGCLKMAKAIKKKVLPRLSHLLRGSATRACLVSAHGAENGTTRDQAESV